MPWKKGQSGNPSGRPKVDKTIQELARSHGPEAIATLAKIMRDPKSPPQARAMASERLLDRGYGKPPQFNTGQTSEFRKAVDMTDDELAAIVAAGRGKVSSWSRRTSRASRLPLWDRTWVRSPAAGIPQHNQLVLADNASATPVRRERTPSD